MYVRESFRNFIGWSNEPIFKFNGTINRQNSVYRTTENQNITEEREVNVPGTSVWCGVPSRGNLGTSS